MPRSIYHQRHSNMPISTISTAGEEDQRFACSKCLQLFTRQTQLDYHRKLVHQDTCTLVRPETTPAADLLPRPVINRSKETGHFHCPGRMCSFSHGKPQIMQNHAKKCVLYASTSIVVPTVAEPASVVDLDAIFGTFDDLPITPSQPHDMSSLHHEMSWSTLLAGGQMPALSALITMPQEARRAKTAEGSSARRLKQAIQQADIMFREMYDVVTKHLPVYLLTLIEHGAYEDKGKKMGRAMGISSSSIDSYLSVFRKLICFLCQAYTIGDGTRSIDNAPETPVQCVAACFRAHESFTGLVGSYYATPTAEGLALMLSAMVQITVTDKGHSSPLHVFLACLAISQRGGKPTWMSVTDYSPLLSRLLYGLRLAFIGDWFYRRRPFVGLDALQSFSADELEQLASMFRSKLATPAGDHTAYSFLCRMQGRAMGMGKSEKGATQLDWSADKTLVTIAGKPLQITVLRECLREHIDELERLLNTLLSLRRLERPNAAEILKLQDNAQALSDGWSFHHHLANHAIVARQKLDTPICDLFGVDVDGLPRQIDQAAVKAYLGLEGQFSQKLAFLIHLTSGYSTRQTELASMTWRNTVDHVRDIRFCPASLDATSPEVLISCHHSKTKLRLGGVTLAQRYAAPRVGECLAIYLLCIRPLTDNLRRSIDIAQRHKPIPHLFLNTHGQKSMGASQFSTYFKAQQLAICAQTGSSVSLLPSEWRQVVNSIGRVHLQHDTFELNDDDDEERDAALELAQATQANHSVQTSRLHYGLELSKDKLVMQDTFRQASRRLQAFLGLNPASGTAKAAKTEAKAATTTTSTPTTTTALGKRKRPATPEPVVPSPMSTDPSPLAVFAPVVDYAPVRVLSSHEGYGSMHRADVSPLAVRAFHALVGRPTSFRSPELATALSLLTSHRGLNVFAILPTGTGKTLLWQIPALLEKWLVQKAGGASSKLTIVIVPFVALLQDTLRRCAQAGLDGRLWSQDMPDDVLECNVVALTVDSAADKHFRSWLAHQAKNDRLLRVVLDEAHVLVADAHYRNKLEEAAEIVKATNTPHSVAPVPILLLSATVPAWIQELLNHTLRLGALQYVRQRNHRPNIAYAVHTHDSAADAFEAVQELVKPHLEREGKDAVLIICRYANDGQDLAKALDCGFFGGDDDARERGRPFLDAFMQHKSKLMIGTTAIGTGLHHEHVRLVISFGEPWTLLDWSQHSGRAGRDQLPAEAIVVRFPTSQGRERYDLASQDDQAKDRFLNSVQCRRSTLGAYLDGFASPCVEYGAEFCDICRLRYRTSSAEGQLDNDPLQGLNNDQAQSLVTALPAKRPRPLAKVAVPRSLDATPISSGPVSPSAADAYYFEDHDELPPPQISSTNPTRKEHVQTLRLALAMFPRNCAYCWAKGVPYAHTPANCPFKVQDRRSHFRKSISFAPGSACYTCGLPPEFHPEGGCDPDQDWKRPTADVVRDLLRGLWHSTPSRFRELAAAAGSDLLLNDRRQNPKGNYREPSPPSDWFSIIDHSFPRKIMYAVWLIVEVALHLYPPGVDPAEPGKKRQGLPIYDDVDSTCEGQSKPSASRLHRVSNPPPKPATTPFGVSPRSFQRTDSVEELKGDTVLVGQLTKPRPTLRFSSRLQCLKSADSGRRAEVEKMMQVLDMLEPRCAYHFMLGEPFDHDRTTCNRNDNVVRGKYARYVRFEDGICCHTCARPIEFHDRACENGSYPRVYVVRDMLRAMYECSAEQFQAICTAAGSTLHVTTETRNRHYPPSSWLAKVDDMPGCLTLYEAWLPIQTRLQQYLSMLSTS